MNVPWCERCQSYHATPKEENHRLALGCDRLRRLSWPEFREKSKLVDAWRDGYRRERKARARVNRASARRQFLSLLAIRPAPLSSGELQILFAQEPRP